MKFLIFLGVVLAFGCSRTDEEIPKIFIKVGSEITKSKKIVCDIIYVENGDSLSAKAAIKRRGGSSMKYKKHSYRVEFDSLISLAGLPKDDDWILNANYIDKTLMRHKISYDLFRQMHPENIAVQCNYVEVFLNNEYRGLYVLMEKVDASTTFLVKKDPSAVLFKEPPVFFEKRLERVQDSTNYFQQKIPKIKKRDKTEFIEEFRQFLFNAPDSVFYEEIGQRVNLRNVMDWHLLLLFSNNSDGILKNFYLLKKNGDVPFEFIPWDYDHSFGRDGDNELNMMRHQLDVNRSILLRRLNASESYLSTLKKRYWEFRESGLFSIKNFDKLIFENDDIIRPYVERNFEKWPVKAYYYFDDGNYDSEIELMRDFVRMRLEILDAFFANAD